MAYNPFDDESLGSNSQDRAKSYIRNKRQLNGNPGYLPANMRLADLGDTVYPFRPRATYGPGSVRASDLFQSEGKSLGEMAGQIKPKEIEDLSEEESELGIGNAIRERVVIPMAVDRDAQYALQKFNIQSEEAARSILGDRIVKNSAFVKPANISTITNSMTDINNRLAQMDKYELDAGSKRKIGRNAFFNKGMLGNRESAFNFLNYRMQDFLKDTGHTAHYQWDPGDMKEGRSAGIWVTIAEKDRGFVGVDDGRAVQFRYDLQGSRGLVTTATGDTHAALPTVFSQSVIRHARTSPHIPDLDVVSKGIYQQSSFLKFKGNAARLRASSGRVLNSNMPDPLEVFSFNEILSAHIVNRFKPSLKKDLMKGNYEEVQRQMELGIKDVYQKGGFTVRVNPHSQDAYIRPAMVNAKPVFMNNPLNFALLDRRTMGVAGQKNLKRILENDQYYLNELTSGEDSEYLKKYYAQMRRMFISPWIKEIDSEDPKKIVNYAMKKIGSASSTEQVAAFTLRANQLEAAGLAGTPKAGQNVMMAREIRDEYIPGGVPAIRPTQWFHSEFNQENPLPAPAEGSNPRAANNFLANAGYEDLMSTDAMRYGRIGMVAGGSYTNSLTGENVPLSADDALRYFGSHEQQSIMADKFARSFGEGANLKDAKLFADISKTMNQLGSSVGAEIRDDDIDMVWGVPLSKLMGKHQSGSLLWRGILGRMLENPEDPHIVRDLLRRHFADADIAHNTTTNMLSMTFKKPYIYSGPQDLVDIMDLVDKVNATRQNPIQIFRDIQVKTAAGINMNMRVADVLLGVKPIENPIPGILKSGTSPIFGQRTIKSIPSKIPIERLERMQAEGLFYHAADWYTRSMTSAPQRRAIRAYEQTEAALFGTFQQNVNSSDDAVQADSKRFFTEQREVAESLSQGSTNLSELYLSGRTKERGPYTPQQYKELYRTDAHTIDFRSPMQLPDGRIIDKLFVPEQTPKSNKDGMLYATKLQQDINNIVRANADTTLSVDARKNNVIRAVSNYEQTLIKELGPTGSNLIGKAYGTAHLEGPGTFRANLAQDMWASGDLPGATRAALRPGESVVGESFAREVAGLQYNSGRATRNRAVLWDAERGMNYFYGTLHREPEVLTGRTATKTYIDPSITEHKVFIHEFDRKLMYGDSDGDTVAGLIANMPSIRRGVALPIDAVLANQQHFRENIAYKQSVYDKIQEVLVGTAKSPDPRLTPGVTAASTESFLSIEQAAIQSSRQVMEQQMHEASAQGIMGNITGNLIDHLRGEALAPEGVYSDVERGAIMGMANLVGEARELVLKTAKSGSLGAGDEEIFNPIVFNMLIRNKENIADTATREMPFMAPGANGPEKFTAAVPLGEDSNYKVREGRLTYKGMDGAAYLQKYFLPQTKSYAGPEGIKSLASHLGDLLDKNPDFMDDVGIMAGPESSVSQLKNVDSMVSFARMRSSIAAGELTEETVRHMGVAGRFMSTAYETGAAAVGIAQAVVSNKRSIKDLGGIIRKAVIHETRPESMGMADVAPGVDRAFVPPGDGPSVPKTTRVRVTERNTGYNIRIQARNNARSAMGDAGTIGDSLANQMGGSISVNVNDARRGMDDLGQSDFKDELKGR